MNQAKKPRKYPLYENRKPMDIDDRAWLEFYITRTYPDRAEKILATGHRYYKYFDDREWRSLRSAWRKYKEAHDSFML